MLQFANKLERNLMLIGISLIVPYLFRATYFYDTYWGTYLQDTQSDFYRLSYYAVFAVLIVRAAYAKRALLTTATLWLVTNLFPENLRTWTTGSVTDFIVTSLYIVGAGLIIKVVIDNQALPHQEIKRSVQYFLTLQNRVWGIFWLIIGGLFALISGIGTINLYSSNFLLRLLSFISITTSMFLLVYLIHKFVTSHIADIRDVAQKLNDFSLNSYMTRKLSSWIYAFLYFGLILAVGFGIPSALSTQIGIDYAPWILLFGYPISMVVGALFAYLILLLLRLVFEYSNALIHVAQNTSR